jgi:hypothetical protein
VKPVHRTTVLVVALAIVGAVLTAVVASPSRAGGPITKQNGSSPAFEAFTSICAVAGFVNYGLCGGDVTKFTDVKGKLNAIQPKLGRYNLDFTFTHLMPGVEYRLWGTRDGRAFFEVGRMFADESGSVKYTLQTDTPAGLGFDLNTVQGDVTLVTSWWSGQYLVVNADGTLSAAGS